MRLTTTRKRMEMIFFGKTWSRQLLLCRKGAQAASAGSLICAARKGRRMRKIIGLLLPATALLVAGCAAPSPVATSSPPATSSPASTAAVNSVSDRLQVFASFSGDPFKYTVDATDGDIVGALSWSWGHLNPNSTEYSNTGDPRYIYGVVLNPDSRLGQYVKSVMLLEAENTQVSETTHQNGPDRLIHGVTVVSDQIGQNDAMTWHVQYVDGWWFLTGLSGPMGTYGNMSQKTVAPVTTAPASNCTNIVSDTIPCTGSPPVPGSHPFDYGAACVFNYPKPTALSVYAATGANVGESNTVTAWTCSGLASTDTNGNPLGTLSLAQENRWCQSRWPGTTYHVDQYASIYGADCR